MERVELENALKVAYENLENISRGVGFVSALKVEAEAQKLKTLLENVKNEGIFSDNYVEKSIQYCWNCRQKVWKIKISFSNPMLRALIKAFEYAIRNNTQTVDISKLWLENSEYSQFNHVVRFWLAFKNDDMITGEYWIPRKRVQQFLNGDWKVAEYFLQNPLKKEGEEWRREMSENRIWIHEVPSVSKLKELYGEKLTTYVWNNDFE